MTDMNDGLFHLRRDDTDLYSHVAMNSKDGKKFYMFIYPMVTLILHADIYTHYLRRGDINFSSCTGVNLKDMFHIIHGCLHTLPHKRDEHHE